jgi:tRNA nucleotidyltransferase (CCA-adding enzyme)
MKVITSHMNADFDSLSSMVAARKLYPDATLVFPGSQEKTLRDFLIHSTLYLFDIAKLKEIDHRSVDTLILVDTRDKTRIGDLAKVADNPKVAVHVYDHHPDSADDVRADLQVVRSVGATVTILVSIIREKGVSLTPEEATIMMLGIYEETGSFRFSSTTVEDFEAASYLLSQGANINLVSDMLVRELTPEQVFLLNDIIKTRPFTISTASISSSPRGARSSTSETSRSLCTNTGTWRTSTPSLHFSGWKTASTSSGAAGYPRWIRGTSCPFSAAEATRSPRPPRSRR